jgi:hypothetical protein
MSLTGRLAGRELQRKVPDKPHSPTPIGPRAPAREGPHRRVLCAGVRIHHGHTDRAASLGRGRARNYLCNVTSEINGKSRPSCCTLRCYETTSATQPTSPGNPHDRCIPTSYETASATSPRRREVAHYDLDQLHPLMLRNYRCNFLAETSKPVA